MLYHDSLNTWVAYVPTALFENLMVHIMCQIRRGRYRTTKNEFCELIAHITTVIIPQLFGYIWSNRPLKTRTDMCVPLGAKEIKWSKMNFKCCKDLTLTHKTKLKAMWNIIVLQSTFLWWIGKMKENIAEANS